MTPRKPKRPWNADLVLSDGPARMPPPMEIRHAYRGLTTPDMMPDRRGELRRRAREWFLKGTMR